MIWTKRQRNQRVFQQQVLRCSLFLRTSQKLTLQFIADQAFLAFTSLCTKAPCNFWYLWSLCRRQLLSLHQIFPSLLTLNFRTKQLLIIILNFWRLHKWHQKFTIVNVAGYYNTCRLVILIAAGIWAYTCSASSSQLQMYWTRFLLV